MVAPEDQQLAADEVRHSYGIDQRGSLVIELCQVDVGPVALEEEQSVGHGDMIRLADAP